MGWIKTYPNKVGYGWVYGYRKKLPSLVARMNISHVHTIFPKT